MKDVPIILVAFGTMSNAAQSIYFQLENDVRIRFPGHEIIWAYTAKSIVTRLRQEGKNAQTLKDAYTILRAKGFNFAVVQSLHLVPGYQHHTIINENSQGLVVSIGSTLLETKTDINEVAVQILTTLTIDQPIMIVTHGNASNNCYNVQLELLEKVMLKANPKIFFTCLEGARDTDRLHRFKSAVQTAGMVHVCPLFLVDGNHVTFDILGSHACSIKSYLAATNFVCSEVLGKQQWARNRFLNKISEAMNNLKKYEA